MRVFLALKSGQLLASTLDHMVKVHHLRYPHVPDDRHMTLLFLGEQTEPNLALITQAIDHVSIEGVEPLIWNARYIADFPMEQPKVWGMQGANTQALSQIVTRLESAIYKAIGIHFNYTFKPHVTLSYIDQATDKTVPFCMAIEFDQLVLYRSYSSVQRNKMQVQEPWSKPRYAPLKVWNLRK